MTQGGSLTATEYHEKLFSLLVPMLPGSVLDASPLLSESGEMITSDGANAFLVKPDPSWEYCFRLRRAHPFDVNDERIAGHLIRAFGEKLVASDQPFFQYLVDRCPQDVVARSMRHRLMDDQLLPAIITALQRWASQTYEGSRISVSIGVDPHPEPASISDIHFSEIVDKDYTKVLSNGLDTLLVLSPSGHVVEHAALTLGPSGAGRIPESALTPIRYLSLARWAKGPRVAYALNRHGEILAFKGTRLHFAFRRGTWFHFAHEARIARMRGSPGQKRLLRAVYASCLDISFARTGGCIAIARRANSGKVNGLVAHGDLLSVAATGKSALLGHLIGQRFDEIPRAIREELAALDGAIVLDVTGKILAAGAIVRVSGGSDGGGRRAAAKALSRLGFAVKISSDGGITAFTDRGSDENPEIAFEVCA